MQIRFDGKRVLVAGGSRGIGRSIALAFAGCGASVAICARSEEALRATERELRATGVAVQAAVCDLASWVTGQTIAVDGGQMLS